MVVSAKDTSGFSELMKENIDTALDQYLNPAVSYNSARRRMEWKPSYKSPKTIPYDSKHHDLVVERENGGLKLNSKHPIHHTNESHVRIGGDRIAISNPVDSQKFDCIEENIQKDAIKARKLVNQKYDAQQRIKLARRQGKAPNPSDIVRLNTVNEKVESSSMLVKLLVNPLNVAQDNHRSRGDFRNMVASRLNFLPLGQRINLSSGFKDNHVSIKPQPKVQQEPQQHQNARHRHNVSSRTTMRASYYR
ncbi:MAG: hypothetical protein MK137_10000 [Rickettsiales bacterium]|nr:hypothetical protein [Rickettsiales bacterium]